MKKILLGSTAVAAAALFAGSAMADPNVTSGSPLTISGYYAFEGGLGIGDTVPGGADRDYDYITGGRIQLDWKATADNGLSYGARIRFELNNRNNSSTTTTTAYPDGDGGFIFVDDVDTNSPNDIELSGTNAYVFVSGGFGTAKFGNVGNAAGENYYLIADDKCLGGCWAGNVEGTGLYAFQQGVPLPQVYPDNPSGTGIWYKTPDISGFTATVSWHPVAGDYSRSANYTSDDGDAQNVIAANVNYHGEFEGGTFDVGGSAAYYDIVGASGDYGFDYGAGAKAYFGPIGVSAWYVASDQGGDTISTVWLSGSYAFGPFTAIAGAALTWGDSSTDVDNAQTYALTLQDELAPGLVAYIEGTYSAYDPNGGGDSVDGATLAGGISFGF